MVDDFPSWPGIDDVESTIEDGNTQLPTPAPEAVLLVADGEDDMAADGVSSSSDDLRTAYSERSGLFCQVRSSAIVPQLIGNISTLLFTTRIPWKSRDLHGCNFPVSE